MGLGTLLFGWPLLPLYSIVKMGELVRDQVERELHDPAVVRRRLEEVEQARAAGAISEEEEARAMDEILQGMIGW
ncbi:gas vesicle protein GvpG [Nonomuraea sp. MCN248]|uniref:Gas vesicle protein GvpG n=1 Tax=Nonomuraea corallina TaxID=2989783 RepID=A0ABT4S6P3_9ACTN|nr:gas vesicle protein GvpG [Nonomuraea corallina]MDA0632852.1 gas vesicle protein GvpG [Nonomuraea corallina]